MSGNHDRSDPKRGLGSAILIMVTAMTVHPTFAQEDWVEFVDESAARIDAAPEVGLDDMEEKDIISGDVDNDGDVDVVIVRKVPFSSPGGKRNVLFLNDGGVFTDVTAEKIPEFLDETDDRDVLLADFDGDGWLDIVTAQTFEDNAPPPPFGQPRIYMNLGEVDGVWQGFQWEPDRMPPISPGPENDGPQFCAVAVGDVTGNGLPDIFFADYETTTEDRLLINDGNGYFTDETKTRFADPQMYVSAFGTDAHIVDFNLDGWNDIVRNNTLGPNEVMVVYNDGAGSFDSFDRIYNQAPYMIEPGDLNGDGRPDLYVVDDSQDRYLFNIGNDDDDHAIWEMHTVTQSPNTEGFGGNTKIADMDGDGILDILVADVDTDAPGCTRRMVVLRGQGVFPDITYSDPFNGASRPWLLQGVFDVEALDVNGDGRLDMWVGTCDGNRIFVQPGAGAAELSFDPASLDFGDVEVGTTAPPQSATLHNTGDGDATGLSFSGLPDAGFEAGTSACGGTLPAGGSCTVDVTFTPAVAGPVTATLHVDGDEGAMADLSLSGNGVEPGGPVAEITPDAFAFEVPQGESDSDTLNVGNVGDADLAWSLAEAEPGAAVIFTAAGAPYRYGLAEMPAFNAPVGSDRASGVSRARGETPADRVVLPAPQAQAVGDFTEGFDDITMLPGAGWALINNSEPVGPSSWFQGNGTVFPSHEGEPDAYIAANYESTDDNGTISNWLLTPEVTIVNGTQLCFWTRTTPLFEEFLDRLEVRMSVEGDSTDVGETAESVGDFPELLLTIEPDLELPNEYPEEWTEFCLTVRERPRQPVTGRFAFRYWVTDSGPDGTNGDYIGIDTVSVTQPDDIPPGDGCDNPVDIPWLAVDPTSGTTAPGGSEPVTVAVDTVGLEPGEHTAQLCVTTNDPAAPLVEVPVSLTVTAADGVLLDNGPIVTHPASSTVAPADHVTRSGGSLS